MGTRRNLTDGQIASLVECQKRYYAAAKAGAAARREMERRSFKRFLFIFFPISLIILALLSFVTREPPMYISERECIKEDVNVGAFVGVSPNPLDWKVDGKSCVEYAEPTLRINPDYLIWVQREQERAADFEALGEEDESY